MTHRAPSEEEKESMRLISRDLDYICGFQEILPEEIDKVQKNLQSPEVRSYINALAHRAKPETALREAFFAGGSVLPSYLGGETTPEVNLGNGFVDYILRLNGHFILIELKTLFEVEVEGGKTDTIKRLKQKDIKWETHKDQILKYIQKGSMFTILTNLREWCFFNKEFGPAEPKPFFSTGMSDFAKGFEVVGDLWDYLRRKNFQTVRGQLDKKFFESLKSWLALLERVEFSVDDKTKKELNLALLNKFIFIQTLDDHFVIDALWIKTAWEENERKWQPKGVFQVLKKFIEEVDNWFYEYYDTELFRTSVFDHVKNDEKNLKLLHDNLQFVLGLTYWQTTFGGYKGVMQYNFQLIDEDILGKAYETYLAEVRHDEGIYYTPRYITEHVVENTIGRVFDELITKIREELMSERLDEAKQLVDKFISVRVMDPACGSGSFLIKAVRTIVEKYKELITLCRQTENMYNKYVGTLTRSRETEENVSKILNIKKRLRADNDRELISRVIVRHIHGNDIDRKALEVAKVNIWLEAIKLSPASFRFDKLPKETNHILPDLEMNLSNGDSLVGLPEDATIEFLSKNHKTEIIRLADLREKYLQDPTNPELVTEIEKTKNTLRSKLDQEFRDFLASKDLPVEIFNVTKPLHWALEFWHLYLDANGERLSKDLGGLDVVLGNPPYERRQVLMKKSPIYVEYLDKSGFQARLKNYDLGVIFIERGATLLRRGGVFGYIVTNKFMQADYGEGIRRFLSSRNLVRELVNFGDQQVFDDATTYTALVFLDNAENPKFKYSIIKSLQRDAEQLRRAKANETYEDGTMSVMSLDSSSLSYKPWTMAIAAEDDILRKLAENDKLDDVARIFVGLQTSEDKVYILEAKEDLGNLVKVYSRSREKEYLLEKDMLRPLLMGKDIKRWVIDECSLLVVFPYTVSEGKVELVDGSAIQNRLPRTWQYLLDNKEKLEKREKSKLKGKPNWFEYLYRKNLGLFRLPKILTQVLASRACFALDDKGEFYFPGGGNAGGYGISVKKGSEFSLKYLCALLNSALLDWYLKKISTRFMSGFYSYARRFSGRLPIMKYSANEKVSHKLEQLVDQLISYERVRRRLHKTWTEWSAKLKNGEQALSDILISDARKTRTGKLEETWVSRVPFYPDESNEVLNREYAQFDVIASSERPILSIYGIDESNHEENIFEMEFGARELMINVYFSVSSALGSRMKLKSLKELLVKTVVPLIQPDPTHNTVNIVRKVIKEFSSKAKSEGLPAISDAVAVDNGIHKLEGQVDAEVFRLYGLSENELNTVVSSLALRPSRHEMILQHYRKT